MVAALIIGVGLAVWTIIATWGSAKKKAKKPAPPPESKEDKEKREREEQRRRSNMAKFLADPRFLK